MSAVAGFGGRLFGGRVQPLMIINRNTLLDLDTFGFTKVNFGGTIINATLQTIVDQGGTIPTGILGGSVAVIKGSFLAGPPTPEFGAANQPVPSERPLGVFINDASGRPFESVSAAGSGKAVFLDGDGSYMDLAIYETNARDPVTGLHTATLLVYAPGDRLFVDTQSGLLTNVLPIDTTPNSFDSPAFNRTLVKNGIIPEVVGQVIRPPVSNGFMLIKWLR